MSQRRDLEILLQMGSGRARDDFKLPRSGTGTFFEKARFEVFLSKSISHASPRPTTTTKMTAIGFSCYGLFIKTVAFAAFLQCVATLLVKSHFSILSRLRLILKGFCVLPFGMSFNIFFRTRFPSQPNQPGPPAQQAGWLARAGSWKPVLPRPPTLAG